MKKIFTLIAVFILFLCSVDAKTEDTNTIDYVNIPFWNHFNDEILVDNIYKVYSNNNDLKAASLKVSQAQRLVKMSFANELPHIGFDGYVGEIFRSSDILHGEVKIPDYTESRFLLPLTLNYELDIWGKNHLKTKSQKKRFEALQQDEKSAYIYITSAFAADYYNLVRVDKLIEIQKQLIDIQQEIVNSVEKKKDIGAATITQLILEKKSLTYFQEQLKNLQEKQDVLKNQLNVILADREFNDINRIPFDNISFGIFVPPDINSDVISKRPDVIKSELNLERIGIDVKVAKREFLPTFNIVGNIGFNAYNLSSSHKFLADVGVVPSLDLFMGGRKVQFLNFKKDEYKIGLENYNKTILTSIQETNDALYMLKSVDDKYMIVNDRLDLSKKEYELMEKRLEIGTADNLNLLYQKQAELMIEIQAVSLKINDIIASINLYQSLGGFDFYTTENI